MIIPFQVDAEEEQEFCQSQPWAVYILLGSLLVIHGLVTFGFPTEAGRVDVLYRFGCVRFHFHWWSAVTAMFLHGSWGHLAGNALFLWIYGAYLERLLGTGRFLVVYFIGGIASMILQLLCLSPFQIDITTVGASGAISAVLGAFLALQPLARLRCLIFTPFSYRPIAVKIPAFIVLSLWFIGQLIYSLGLIGVVEEVAFWAHIGGFAAGAVLATLLYGLEQRRQQQRRMAMFRELAASWQAVAAGDFIRARDLAAEIDTAALVEVRANRRLLTGLLAGRVNGDGEKAFAELNLVFDQAKDYRDDAGLLSAYLQLLRLFPEDQIPSAIHRDAGHAAVRTGQPRLAVKAFVTALQLGLESGSAQTVTALIVTLRKKLQQPELAIEVEHLAGSNPAASVFHG